MPHIYEVDVHFQSLALKRRDFQAGRFFVTLSVMCFSEVFGANPEFYYDFLPVSSWNLVLQDLWWLSLQVNFWNSRF